MLSEEGNVKNDGTDQLLQVRQDAANYDMAIPARLSQSNCITHPVTGGNDPESTINQSQGSDISDMDFERIDDGGKYRVLTFTRDFSQPPIQVRNGVENVSVVEMDEPPLQVIDFNNSDNIFNESYV